MSEEIEDQTGHRARSRETYLVVTPTLRRHKLGHQSCTPSLRAIPLPNTSARPLAVTIETNCIGSLPVVLPPVSG